MATLFFKVTAVTRRRCPRGAASRPLGLQPHALTLALPAARSGSRSAQEGQGCRLPSPHLLPPLRRVSKAYRATTDPAGIPSKARPPKAHPPYPCTPPAAGSSAPINAAAPSLARVGCLERWGGDTLSLQDRSFGLRTIPLLFSRREKGKSDAGRGLCFYWQRFLGAWNWGCPPSL